MSRTADVLMEAQRYREERDRKLRSALTVGQLRAILDNIPAHRDNVPVVVVYDKPVGEFSSVRGWRGEKWGGTVADGNVLALYVEE